MKGNITSDLVLMCFAKKSLELHLMYSIYLTAHTHAQTPAESQLPLYSHRPVHRPLLNVNIDTDQIQPIQRRCPFILNSLQLHF